MPARNPHPTPAERDEPIKIDLDPKTALRGLMAVDPEDKPVPQDESVKDQGDQLDERASRQHEGDQ
jgi:hypothetical protein